MSIISTRLYRNYIVCFVVFLFFFSTYFVFASTLSVTPSVLDVKLKASDMIQNSVLIKNNTNDGVRVFGFVNDIAPDVGFKSPGGVGMPTDDRPISLGSWLEFWHGEIRLGPHEEKKFDITIHVNPMIVPGLRHAVLYFATGPSENSEDAKTNKDRAILFLNAEVNDSKREMLQVREFKPLKQVSFGFPVTLMYSLENTGDFDVVPSGEIRIYNQNGKEVGTIPVNKEEALITQGAQRKITTTWSGDGDFGRYKAHLDLKYGAQGDKSVEDIIFFWIIPTRMLLVIVGVFAFVLWLLGFVLFRE